MQYVRGRVFRDTHLPELSPQDRKQVYLGMAQVLAQLHSTQPKELALAHHCSTLSLQV
jgi:aminoglycoside phosphotransferase (APT) family kinase protein